MVAIIEGLLVSAEANAAVGHAMRTAGLCRIDEDML